MKYPTLNFSETTVADVIDDTLTNIDNTTNLYCIERAMKKLRN